MGIIHTLHYNTSPGPRFINGSFIAFQIRWKFRFILTSILTKRSLHNFVHDTAASSAIVACAKICCDLMDSNGIIPPTFLLQVNRCWGRRVFCPLCHEYRNCIVRLDCTLCFCSSCHIGMHKNTCFNFLQSVLPVYHVIWSMQLIHGN